MGSNTSLATSVLVTAASKHGATAGIADAIAQRLCGHGMDVHFTDPGEVRDLDGIDAVVLGSAVYAGRWLPEASDMSTRLQGQLRAKQTWLFSSGPIGDPLLPVSEPSEVAELVERTGAVEHRTFPGAMDRTRLGRADRLIVRVLRAPDGDFRDLDDVRTWADSIAASLLARRG